MQNLEVSVIIPAYNEEHRLPKTLSLTIEYLQKQPYTSEILIVTDGSTDRTEEVARSFASQFQNLRVISFARNGGKGFGVREGMLAARGKYRIFEDADGAVSIEYLSAMIAQAKQGFDVVIASRALRESTKVGRQPFPREELTVCFGYLQRFVLRLNIVDTQCGFKLLTSQAAETVFPQVRLNCAYFDAEMLYLAKNLGYSIAEVPVVWTHDNETRLPIGFKRAFDILAKLFKIRISHRKTIAQKSLFKPAGEKVSESSYVTSKN